MEKELNFAILIDADNISEKYIRIILSETSKIGVATYKRIYGDWTNPQLTKWKKVLLDNSIIPIQQYSYTSGKSSTDAAMIIDAMDILYSGNVDGFVIASSDSDFTRLVARLRESGKQVIGMGESKTPKPFIAACNQFKYLDKLHDAMRKAEKEAEAAARAEAEKAKAAKEAARQKAEAAKQKAEAARAKAKAKTASRRAKAEAAREAEAAKAAALAAQQAAEQAQLAEEEKLKQAKAIAEAEAAEAAAEAEAEAEAEAQAARAAEEAAAAEAEAQAAAKQLSKGSGDLEGSREDQVPEDEAGENATPSTNLTLLKIEIKNLMEECSDDDGWIFSAELGNQLAKRLPDFDVRNFGYSKFSLFINSLNIFEIRKETIPGNNNVRHIYYKLKEE